ncbi:MAG: PQQ-dependent sugar dehydrogenase [Chloroflexi bacterium]|nr:PQQ-dependent sugar dehydrogenase [Chloroflexota bacterium]
MPRTRLHVRWGAAAIALIAVSLLSFGPVRSRRVDAAASISLEPVAGNVPGVTALVSSPDTSGRLFIVQESGTVRILQNGSVLPTPFLDISSLLPAQRQMEQGLLGLAFDPSFATNGVFYVDYVDVAGDIQVSRYGVKPAAPNIADPASGVSILNVPHRNAANHYGGQLAFGPDGYLYISTGDGGEGGDPENNAQNLGALLGKILRIDVAGAAPYVVPADNPFVGVQGARPEVWAYGLRNPWRFSFDRTTGDLLIGDVGQDVSDEVDFQPAGSTGGQNYGWRLMEGTFCYNPSTNCNPGGLTPPVLQLIHGNGDCALIGGYRYRGAAPSLQGTYIYGDFCSGRIWGATRSTAGAWSSSQLLDTNLMISAFGEDQAGELYVADYAGNTVYRIAVPDTDGDGVPDGADNCPAIPNPGQENADGEVTRPSPSRSFDDITNPNGDGLGDACDSDADNDGLTNAEESALGPAQASHTVCPSASANTDPRKLDSDGDGFTDKAECALGSDPASAASTPIAAAPDSDRDGLSNAFETAIGTDPAKPDSDADGLTDGTEVLRFNTNPLVANTDGDACSDGKEAASINADRTVNALDLLVVSQSFGPANSGRYVLGFDVNRDRAINSIDLLLTARLFGPCT